MSSSDPSVEAFPASIPATPRALPRTDAGARASHRGARRAPRWSSSRAAARTRRAGERRADRGRRRRDGDRDPGQARIPVFDLDRLRWWLTDGEVVLGRIAVVSVELDNLAHVNERLGYTAGAHLHRGDHEPAPCGDPSA